MTKAAVSLLRPCPVCRQHRNLQGHHLIPKEYGGDQGPIVYLCASCHMACHHQALSYKSKRKGPRKEYFAPEHMERAMPYVEQIIIASLRADAKEVSSESKMISFKLDNDTHFKLHLLKRDKGFKSLEKFLVALMRAITKDL